MHCFKKLVGWTLVVFIAIGPLLVFGETDSLQVKVVNTPTKVSNIRFIERDSSNLILRVLDDQGKAFEELTPAQLNIVRGQEQARILAVSPLQSSAETNVHVVLALDNSASMSRSKKELIFSVRQLFQTLQGKSQFSLVLFDENDMRPQAHTVNIDGKTVNIVNYDFTSNLNKLLEQVEWNFDHALTSRTYLHDEILAGLQQIKKTPDNVLRIMIVLSDGRDLGSQFGFKRVLKEATAAGIPIYGIDYSPGSGIDSDMRKLVATTPEGKVYKASKSKELITAFEELGREIVNEFQVTYRFPVAPSGSIVCVSDCLSVTTQRLTDEFPMLNYVFFDSNSANIMSRYHTFSSSDEATNFEEIMIPKPLDKYYHVLNVIGKRAKQNPEIQLSLTGCNMNIGAEHQNIELSRRRAENVGEYFQKIWEIEPARIKIKTANLPQKASSTKSTAGLAENRRVEIAATNPEVLQSVRSEVSEHVYSPEIGRFNIQISAPEGLKEWEFRATYQNKLLVKRIYQEPRQEITWNWTDSRGEKITDLSHLMYGIKITDSLGKTFSSNPEVLSIAASEVSPMRESHSDSIIEKFSLILFDFNSSKLGSGNQRLMQKVKNIYTAHPNAKIKVLGYSDDIGSEDYNQRLSTQRAKMAYNSLLKMRIPASQMSYHGYGEINPIFNNENPEGRFLNRTVQVLISYPSGVVADK